MEELAGCGGAFTLPVHDGRGGDGGTAEAAAMAVAAGVDAGGCGGGGPAGVP